ncbi:MAG: hypothetical protein LAP87_04000 [Acidobacteriia bacterium]|nr:hypothetical protein [Terriglobia bacterium]
MCAESLLHGVAGGIGGLLFSLWACEWLRLRLGEIVARISGGQFNIYLDVSPDWRVFAYTAALSAVTGIAIGIGPAFHASRRDVSSGLKQAASGRRRRGLLLSAKVAACLMLLAGAGLLFRGVWRSAVVFPDVPDLTYGAGAFPPATFCGVLAVLAAVTTLASFLPVRRATRIAPAEALRND